jgi:hypothetical protein
MRRSVWQQHIRVVRFAVRLLRRGRKCRTFLSLQVCKQRQYIAFCGKTACPIYVSGGGRQFKQLHLPCALKGNRVHKTTRPSRHTRASVKLPPRHGAFVRVKEMSEFAQTCGLTSLKITVVNFWVMTPCNLAGVLVSPI